MKEGNQHSKRIEESIWSEHQQLAGADEERQKCRQPWEKFLPSRAFKPTPAYSVRNAKQRGGIPTNYILELICTSYSFFSFSPQKLRILIVGHDTKTFNLCLMALQAHFPIV
ncbi:MAG: hypothetical protein EZS28_005256 [Streblomastix strix]|uniref:Uncharacterized protein n=1 Tax=Streblomastix strix TaxID=222440 RepID=A0A5J4WW73_9EUKA|nr:MAG: hypothetical protein EZS28_005256 [Streblomastix strix]